jgi:excinuclease ABC subunit B
MAGGMDGTQRRDLRLSLVAIGPATESKIYRPTSTREANNLGPTPRSSGGASGHRGGWKKR